MICDPLGGRRRAGTPWGPALAGAQDGLEAVRVHSTRTQIQSDLQTLTNKFLQENSVTQIVLL